ncbi:MAG TPA: outer membrane beta-barrel protein [Povalibacter sp.]
MSHGNKLALAAACIVCVAPMVHAEDMAHAEDAGWYVGAGIGQSRTDIEGEGSFFQRDDEWVDSWSLTGGYRFSPWFALEAGYMSLGTLTFRSDTSVPDVFDVNTRVKVEGFNAALVGSLPLGSAFDLHGRFGVLFSNTDLNIVFPDSGFRQSASGNDRDVFYGAGVAWHVNENWSLSLDYQRYLDIGPDDRFPSSESDVESVGINAFFKF